MRKTSTWKKGGLLHLLLVAVFALVGSYTAKAADLDLTTDPVNGATVTELGEITLNWENNNLIWKQDVPTPPTISHNGVTTDISDNISAILAFGNSTITFDPPYTEKGEYVITIPAGYYKLRPMGGSDTYSNEIVLKYTVGDEPTLKSINYESVKPANNSIVKNLDPITLIWADGYTLQKADDVSNPTLLVGTDGSDGSSYIAVSADNPNQVVISNLGMIISTPTTFGFIIPEGYFNILNSEGKIIGYNPEITLSYEYVEPPKTVNYETVEPANNSKVTTLGDITITWPADCILTKTNDVGKPLLHVGTGNLDGSSLMQMPSSNQVVITKLSMLISGPTTFGYTIPEGYFSISDADGNVMGVNPEIVLSYEYVEEEGGGDGTTLEPMLPDSIDPFPMLNTLETLTKVTLGWSDATAYAPTEGALSGNICGSLSKGGQKIANLYFDKEIKVTIRPTLSFTINLGDLATTQGFYAINIPEGFIQITTPEGTAVNATFTLSYNVSGIPEDLPPTVIEENVPFVLTSSVSDYSGEFTPSMTGILTISYDPTLPANFSNRPFLYEANKETPVEFEFVIVEEGGLEKISAFRYDVTEGNTYYFLVGDSNPDGLLINRSPSYTITFTMEEGSLSGGDEPDPGPGDEPGNGPLEAYQFEASTGTYTEITDGTVVFDEDVYNSLLEDGLQIEANYTAIVFGDNGMLSSTVFPGEPTKLPGIPFGFEFPFNGQTFDHFLIGANGYVMLGGEEIGNIIIDSAPGMGGSMGKFIFGQNVPNVIGSVPNWMTGYLPETEISYATDSEGLTVQFKNMGVRLTMFTDPVPVDYQLKLCKDGTVKMIYDNWATLETADNSSKRAGLQIGLKGDEGKMITLVGAGSDDNLVGATIVYDSDYVNTVYVDPTLPNGYTLTFSLSQEDCEAPVVYADLTVETTSTALKATISDPTGKCDGYLMVMTENQFIMWQPEDGVKYEPGQVVTTDAGLVMTVLSAGPETEAFVDGLKSNTRYYVAVWPFNSYCANGPVYMMGYGFPPMNTSELTLAAGPVSLSATGCELNSITLKAEANSEGNDIIVIMTQELEREDNLSDDPVIGELDPYTKYEVGDELEGGGIVVYVGSASDEITISDLDNSTPYYFAALTYQYYDYGGGYGYADISSDVVYAAGSTVVLPPYDMDFSIERRFVAPAGWTSYCSTDARDPFGVWTKSTLDGFGGENVTTTYFLRFSLGGVPASGANAWFVTSPIYVDKEGYTASMVFNGEIYPESLRDPAGPLTLAEGDFIALSVSKDGGETFTEAMKYTSENFEKTYESATISADLSDYVNEYVKLKFEWKTSVVSYSGTGGSQLFVTSYTVGEDSGVENMVAADTDRYVVYTLSGIKVLDTENAADLNALSEGLYIINGKKVMIAK